jgi:hypothetical protein
VDTRTPEITSREAQKVRKRAYTEHQPDRASRVVVLEPAILAPPLRQLGLYRGVQLRLFQIRQLGPELFQFRFLLCRLLLLGFGESRDFYDIGLSRLEILKRRFNGGLLVREYRCMSMCSAKALASICLCLFFLGSIGHVVTIAIHRAAGSELYSGPVRRRILLWLNVGCLSKKYLLI